MYRYIIIVSLLAPLALAAQPAQKAPFHLVEARGTAPLYNGDLALARRMAIADARVRALESLGVEVWSQNLLQNYSLVLEQVNARTRGFIRTDQVIEDRGVNADSLYEVLIQAWIDTALTPEVARQQRRKQVVVVDIPVEIQGARAGLTEEIDRSVQIHIADALGKQGFQVYSPEDIEEISAVLGRLGVDYDLSERQNLQQVVMAGIVVHGTVRVRLRLSSLSRLVAFEAKPDIRATEPSLPPRTIATFHRTSGFKGVHTDTIRALELAMEKVAAAAAAALLPELLEFAQRDIVRVELAVSGVPDLERYRSIKQMLQRLLWVEKVEADERFDPDGISLYRIHYKRDLDLLAAQLHYLRELSVKAIENLSIKARFRQP